MTDETLLWANDSIWRKKPLSLFVTQVTVLRFRWRCFVFFLFSVVTAQQWTLRACDSRLRGLGRKKTINSAVNWTKKILFFWNSTDSKFENHKWNRLTIYKTNPFWRVIHFPMLQFRKRKISIMKIARELELKGKIIKGIRKEQGPGKEEEKKAGLSQFHSILCICSNSVASTHVILK